MNIGLRLLASALRIVAGYVAASFAGALALIVITMTVMAAESDPELPTIAAGAVFAAMFFALFVGFMALVPGLIAVAIAEAVPIRAWWYFTLAGVVAAGTVILLAMQDEGPPAETGAVTTIIAAGAVAGFTYWLTAGRWSGVWRDVTSPG